MTDLEYRQLSAISNSDLNNLKRQLFNLPPLPQKAISFGRIAHEYILENAITQDFHQLSKKEQELIVEMKHKLTQHKLFSYYFNKAKKQLNHSSFIEKVIIWNEPNTGATCKIKSDIFVNFQNHSTILDLKTTSETSQEAFCESIIKYDYHQQAAFYLDAIRYSNSNFKHPKEFVIIGISKKIGSIFAEKLSISDPKIQKGRKQYLSLLKHLLHHRA